MSDSILKAKQEVLQRFFQHISRDKLGIKINDLDNFENIVVKNKEFKELETEIIDLINDLTYYTIGKLDIRLNGIDETMINKIALQKARNGSIEKKRESMKFNTYTKLYQQNVNMERIKLQEIKKTNRSLLRTNKNINFEINKDIYLNYFCDNMKDMIIVEKLLLILEPLIASKKLIIHKKEDIKTNKTHIESEVSKKFNEQQDRGRRATKDIKRTEIDLTSGKGSLQKKKENGRNQSKSKDQSDTKRDLSVSNISERKKMKKKEKAITNTSLSKSHSPGIENETREAIKLNDISVSKGNETNLNSKKKRRKTKKKNKTQLLQNTPDKIGILSEDKSDISDDNIEKNKLNFLQALNKLTINMLLESKIKGENVECIVEPEVIPDLEKLLGEPTSKTQRNTNEISKQMNKNMNLSNDEYDYNNITDRSNILSNNQRNKILISKKANIQDENVSQNFEKSLHSKSEGQDKFKINETEVNKTIVMNVSVDEENKKDMLKKVKSNANNIPLTDRSVIYRVDNSNHDLSKENRLELVSTNDKNEYKSKGRDVAEKPGFVNDTDKANIKLDQSKNAIDKPKEIDNGGNAETHNEDIIINEKINDNEKIKTKNTSEINSLGKTPDNVSSKPVKKIEDDKILTKKKKSSDGCKCVCSIF